MPLKDDSWESLTQSPEWAKPVVDVEVGAPEITPEFSLINPPVTPPQPLVLDATGPMQEKPLGDQIWDTLKSGAKAYGGAIDKAGTALAEGFALDRKDGLKQEKAPGLTAMLKVGTTLAVDPLTYLGSTVGLKAAKTAGQIAIKMLPEAFKKSYPVLSELIVGTSKAVGAGAGNAPESAALNALQSFSQGGNTEQVKDAFNLGGAAGFLLPFGAVAGASTAKAAAVKISDLDLGQLVHIAHEVRGLRDVVPPTTVPSHKLKTVDPSVVVLDHDERGLFGMVTTMKQGVEPQVFEVRIDSDFDAAQIGNLVRKHGVVLDPAPGAMRHIAELSDYRYQRLYRGSRKTADEIRFTKKDKEWRSPHELSEDHREKLARALANRRGEAAAIDNVNTPTMFPERAVAEMDNGVVRIRHVDPDAKTEVPLIPFGPHHFDDTGAGMRRPGPGAPKPTPDTSINPAQADQTIVNEPELTRSDASARTPPTAGLKDPELTRTDSTARTPPGVPSVPNYVPISERLRPDGTLSPEPKTAPGTTVDVARRGHPIGGGSGKRVDEPFQGAPPRPVPVKPAKPDILPTPTGTMTEDIKATQTIVNKMIQARMDRGPLANLIRSFRHGSIDILAKNRSIKASQRLKADRSARYEEAILNGFKMPKGDAFYRELHKAFTGDMTPDQLWAKYPQIGTEAKALASNLFEQREAFERELVELGGVAPEMRELRDAGTLQKYAARQYMAHILPPGEWVRYVKTAKTGQALMADAIAFITKENPSADRIDVARQIYELLGADDVKGAMLENAMGGGMLKPFERVLKRQDIPEPLRNLLGEVQSADITIPLTLAHQASLVGQLKAMNALADNPEVFSPVLREGLHPTRIPFDPQYGKMAGGFVTADLYDLVVEAPKLARKAPSIMRELVGHIKGNQFIGGGVGPFINNIFGNLESGMFAGGLTSKHPWRNFKTGWQAWKDYKLDPTGRVGLGGLITEAQQYGGDFAGMSSAEVGNPKARAFIRDVERILEQASPEADLYSVWGKINRMTADKYKGLIENIGGGQEFVDRLFRLQSYVANREEKIAELVKAGALASDPKTLAQAAEYAAGEVQKFFYNPADVPHWIQKAEIPFITNMWMRPIYESLRIHGNVLAELAGPKKARAMMRLMAGATVIGAGVGVNGILRNDAGISGEEATRAVEAQPDGRRQYRPLQYALGVRDDKGEPTLWDWTGASQIGRFLQSSPDLVARAQQGHMPSLAGLAAQKLVMPLFEGSLAEPAVRGGFEAMGANMGQPAYDAGPPKPGSTFPEVVGQAALQANRAGILGPTAISKAHEGLRKGGAVGTLSRGEDKMSPTQATLKGLGLPIANTGPNTRRMSVEQYDIQIGQLTKAMKRVIMSNDPPERKKRLVEGVRKEIDFLRKRKIEMQNTVNRR